MRSKPRVKICCIASLDEARVSVASGASASGLVSSMLSGPGVIPEESIADRRADSTADCHFLAHFHASTTTSEALITHQRRCGTNTLQLCDYPEVSVYRELRRELPGVAVVQVIHVTGPESLDRAREAAEHVHALLLDSGDTTLPVKLLGGTGRTHDWSTSRRIRDAVGVPVFLAGGLTAINVAEAVATVEPFGLDLCSGVRTNHQLDAAKLGAFFSALTGG